MTGLGALDSRTFMKSAAAICLAAAIAPIWFLAPPATAQAPAEINPGVPPISVEPSVFDFGFLAPNANGRGSVQIRNNSAEPMTVLKVEPTCKCTTISKLDGAVIPPGETVELEAELAGAPALGPRTAAVKVIIQGYARPVEVPVRAEVAMKVRSVPAYINAIGGRNLTGRLVVESTDKAPFRILTVDGHDPHYLSFDPAKDAPRASYLLEYDLSEAGPEGVRRFWVVLTDHPIDPVLDVRVRHDAAGSRPVVKMRDYRVNCGRIADGGSYTATVETDIATPIQTVLAGNKDAEVELISTESDAEWSKATVRVTPRAGLRGLMYLPLMVGTARGIQEVDCFGIVGPR